MLFRYSFYLLSKKNIIGLMGWFFDNEKINKSIQISVLFMYKMLKAAAFYRTAVNQNT
jgi:hypothetical protein